MTAHLDMGSEKKNTLISALEYYLRLTSAIAYSCISSILRSQALKEESKILCRICNFPQLSGTRTLAVRKIRQPY